MRVPAPARQVCTAIIAVAGCADGPKVDYAPAAARDSDNISRVRRKENKK